MKRLALHWQIFVLESTGVNPAGIAHIFAVDRPLDMLRTATNISGDSMYY